MKNTLTLEDKHEDHKGEKILGIEGTADGLAILPEGYGENGTQAGHGAPVYIELHKGELRLLVWADINQPDPTHIICLDGAKESNRGKPLIDGNNTREFGPKPRWVFTDRELLDIEENGFMPCDDDEFIVYANTLLPGMELGVIVQRNGVVTNRWSDGTVGVPDEVKEIVEGVEDRFTMDGDSTIWRYVTLMGDEFDGLAG